MSEDPARLSRLVETARRGDASAFVSLIQYFDPELRILAHRLLGQSWSDDVLQDSYLRAFSAVGRFDPTKGSFGGWLYRIVYRRCLDELRRHRRVQSAAPESVDEAIAEEAWDGDTDTRLDLWAVIGSLSPEDRACLVLVDALGFDYTSAAEVIEVPRGTVASRLNRARRIVRETFSPREEAQHARVQRHGNR